MVRSVKELKLCAKFCVCLRNRSKATTYNCWHPLLLVEFVGEFVFA